jgi:hypothetical protein
MSVRKPNRLTTPQAGGAERHQDQPRLDAGAPVAGGGLTARETGAARPAAAGRQPTHPGSAAAVFQREVFEPRQAQIRGS